MVRTPPFIGVRAIESFMAMLDIEYRYSGRPTSGEVRRADWEEMEKYLRGLVYEMQEADISSKYIGTKTEDVDMVYINGKSVIDILNGLEIRTPMPDECECEYSGKVRPITIGRPALEWNPKYIEDIPDILMKNAISKTYADINRDRIM